MNIYLQHPFSLVTDLDLLSCMINRTTSWFVLQEALMHWIQSRRATRLSTWFTVQCRTALTVWRARGLSTTRPAGCWRLPVGGGGAGAAAGGGQRRRSRPAAGRRLQVLRQDLLHLFVHITCHKMAQKLGSSDVRHFFGYGLIIVLE